MVEYGESFWRSGWAPLYSVLGGNPLAAMPSLHFATSAMAALLLAESGPLAGARRHGYAARARLLARLPRRALCRRLLGGLALTLAVRRLERVAGSSVRAIGTAIERIGRFANGPPD